MSVRIITGDALAELRKLPDESVHCCVTSPPYFGLRDYGIDGQIGLEPSPDEYVAALVTVFREVRRVLRSDGTLWLNLGDSYSAHAGQRKTTDRAGIKQQSNVASVGAPSRCADGCKPKDLIGIPWAVAKALRDPYYTGRIKDERDRVWMAAMVDGEGTICGFRHVRPDGNVRTGSLVFITNGSEAILDNCERIWPGSRYLEHLKEGDTVLGATATRPCWRWQIQMAEDRALFLREIYPYLVAKRRQAIVGYALSEIAASAKRYGRGGDAAGLKEKRDVLVGLLGDLNNNRPCVMPGWLKEPPSPTEPGWYLRQDIIWSKSNPMPESVTDRCTKAHEYLFLLSKSERYYFDAAAISEPMAAPEMLHQSSRKTSAQIAAFNGHAPSNLGRCGSNPDAGRNKRSVWTVTTEAFPEAHFATFPPALIEPCILAGCPEGGTVLDCFGGAGTTGLVADRLGRNAVLIELNPEYSEMARRRIHHDAPLFADVAVHSPGRGCAA